MTAVTQSIPHLRNANWIGNRSAASRKASMRPSSGTSIIQRGGNRCSNAPAAIELYAGWLISEICRETESFSFQHEFAGAELDGLNQTLCFDSKIVVGQMR